MLDIIGYVASFIILVSLLMSSVKKLRIINLFGSLIFAVYGFLIVSYPTAVMNLGIVIIDLYYLLKMQKQADHFKMIEIDENNALLKNFLETYQHDIETYMKYDISFSTEKYVKLFVMRNAIPAGLFIYQKQADQLLIYIDYTTPEYRDYKIGKYLYGNSSPLLNMFDVHELISKPGNKKHQRYLKCMGFNKTTINNETYMMKNKT